MEQTKTFENNGQLVCFTNNYALIITGDCLRVVSPNNPYITIEGKHVREAGNLIGNYVGIGEKFEGKTAVEWYSIYSNYVQKMTEKYNSQEKEIAELQDYIKETRDSKTSMLGLTLKEWVKKNEQNQSIISQQSLLIQQQAAELDGLRAEVMELKGRLED